MSAIPPHMRAEAARSQTETAQSRAADPATSAWVNANAGAGKTYVLTQRVLRLLLAGTDPERILCLTYTKAAAAEMSTRVFDELAKWVTEDEAKLTIELTAILRRPATADEMAFARTLFTRAIETPGGLKVQTIHAFCERLLQRFPLEAGVPPSFKILDDERGRELRARAIEATLQDATRTSSPVLGKALSVIIRYATDAMFDELLTKAINERAWLTAASRLELGRSTNAFEGAEAYLRGALGIAADVTADDLLRQRASVLTNSALRELRDLLQTGGKSDVKHAAFLTAAMQSTSDNARGDCLAEYFLVSDDSKARADLMTVRLARARPDVLADATRAQGKFLALTRDVQASTLIEASAALYRLAGAMLERYTAAKQSAGALDFDDLIERTTNLLSTSDETQWVLFKLDGGLDHILVDEAQDTSPSQWLIIAALAREFFSSRGARDVQRTVFAVGDEKQSIYSFQGAAPEMFARMGQAFADLAQQETQPWRTVPLNLSFRTVQPILDGVDQVFSNSARTPGLTATDAAITHTADRAGQAGLVEIWPVIEPDDADAVDPWDPLSDASPRAPANQLAEKIAATIDGWLSIGEQLPSQGRAVRAGDILILVRKRHPFAVPMVAALKARGIAVAGSDRIALTDQIVVQDLLVLGDFLTLPEDDLALATILKSPLFGLDDDHLLSLAHGRKGTMWKALLTAADSNAAFKPAAETLKRWRAKADFLPPFEFFSSVLDRDGARSKLLHRLGPEAADAIDEFLDLALAYDDASPPSLAGFLANLRAAERNIKRDMDIKRDEVRVMTVHGAKGLEAPIVFLPDTCTTSTGDGNATRLLTLRDVEKPDGLPDPIVWPVKGLSRLEVVQRAKAAKDARDAEERNRLLYVAMTRARDRLYVAGFQGKRKRSTTCWYDVVFDALTPRMTKVDIGNGVLGWRISEPQTAGAEKLKSSTSSAVVAGPLPPFARARAPVERELSLPLAPSRLEAYGPDSDGEPLPAPAHDPAMLPDQWPPAAASDGARFLRGTLTHALLEHLPAIAASKRRMAAEAFVGRRGTTLSPSSRQSIVSEVMAILSEPTFAPLFSPSSRAEVAISAMIPRPSGVGPALRLSGQIDRLAITDTDVFIVDYKTNRPPPMTVAQVADAYLFQLAAYVLALGEIYPDKAVRAALLWTDGPRLMEVPKVVIDDAIKRLWSLDFTSLDAP